MRHGPQKAHACTSHGHDHQVGVLPSGSQAAVAGAPSDVGLPADVLERLGWVCQSPWEMPTDFRGRARGPGARNERATGMGSPGWGDRPLLAPLPTGGGRRGQAPRAHALSGMRQAGEVTQGGDGRDGDGARHTAQGLQRCDHWGEAPGGDRLLACVFETLQPFRRCVDRADLCLEHAVLCRGRPDDCREPPEVSRVPGGLARRAEVVPQHKGFQT